ncbi:hypothetical protein ACT29H_16655 [Thermophagus sp. OGC60D27]|uniref:hypothetical protein n=1 Tax=Thermophagus sp. OGC60D27 TaxID=3458415 RepID=UPI00403836A0
MKSTTKSSALQTTDVPLFGDWENSVSRTLRDIKNVEVPVFSPADEATYSEALKGISLPNDEEKEKAVGSRIRIVVQTNQVTGETHGFLMTVIPDEDYLASGGSIDSIDYYNRGTNFTGLIVFNHLDGNFANAWKYDGGEIVSGFIPMVPEKTDSEKSLKALAQIEYLICTDTYVSFGSLTSYVGSDCWLKSETIWYYEDYYWDSRARYAFENGFDPPIQQSSGGSNNHDSSGSNTVGVYLPYDPIKETPLTISLQNKNRLTPAQSLILEKAL